MISRAGKGSVIDNEGDVGKRVEIIPYHPSQIKIEKRGSKRTSIFCATRKTSSAAIKTVLEHQDKNKPNIAVSDCSSVSIVDDSEFLDEITVVPDISDLSIISFRIRSSFSDTCKFDHSSTSTGTFQNQKDVLPAVHGKISNSYLNPTSKQRFRKKFTMAQLEKNTFASQSNISSSQKAVFAQMKEYNFQLRRENVNLKNQVESLQSHQRAMAPLQSVVIANEVLKQRNIEENGYEFRAQLRNAHDEIFRLQKEDTKRALDLKGAVTELSFSKQKAERLLKEKAELVIANEDLLKRIGELENLLSCVRTGGASDAENQLMLMKADYESLKISKKWYEEQLQETQKSRKMAEKDLVAGKLEVSIKNAEILELQGKLDEMEYLLQKEKRKFESEKESFTQKLKNIENDMVEQESQLDQIQKEKDTLILELSEKLNSTNEGDFTTVHDLSENIKELETDMNNLRQSLEQKDTEISSLQTEKNDTLNRLELISQEFQVRNKSFIELEAAVFQMEKDNRMVKDRLNQVQDENQKLVSEAQENIKFLDKHKLLSSELNEQKQLAHNLRENIEVFKAQCHHLEQELMHQRNCLDITKAETVKLEQELQEKTYLINSLETEMQDLKLLNTDIERSNIILQNKLEASTADKSKLQEDLNILAMQLNSSPDPDLVALNAEIVELRKTILNLEQFENETMELREENDALSLAKDNLNDKLLEAEKIYEDEVENLREMVVKRDEVITSMRSELETIEQDLGRTKEILESNLLDQDRLSSEQIRKLEDLEFALEDYDVTKRQLVENVASLNEAEEKLGTLQEDNESLVEQLQKILARSETLEHDNQRLSLRLERDHDAGEEEKEMQAQRIARLEGFVAEYEKEIEELASAKSKLENQIITLEATNGKLQSESVLNETLRKQLQQLQLGLKNDTNLREELVRNIELAKASLGEEISSLESALQSERHQYVRAKEVILHLESENLELQQEVNGLQLQVDDFKHKVARLECKSSSINHGEAEGHARELEHFLEEKNRSICSLEDHISTLKFHLQQKSVELEDARNTARTNAEKLETCLERFQESEKTLREELSRQAKSLETLAEERNNYRSQVQQMNLALRNSLEHIKQLRSQASASSSPSLDDSLIVSDLLQRTSTPGRNLTNLQNCLASLRTEMALLQVRLAPSERRSLNGSISSSPEAKDATN